MFPEAFWNHSGISFFSEVFARGDDSWVERCCSNISPSAAAVNTSPEGNISRSPVGSSSSSSSSRLTSSGSCTSGNRSLSFIGNLLCWFGFWFGHFELKIIGFCPVHHVAVGPHSLGVKFISILPRRQTGYRIDFVTTSQFRLIRRNHLGDHVKRIAFVISLEGIVGSPCRLGLQVRQNQVLIRPNRLLEM